ncbi:alpha/beta fold hydrolase [Streptomyces sp. RGM 3693]|uniref:alpha/beta fold hydrolase n=1 Tax=Streptomyces sp. RGM 3693 TaxID=3413284 RepID=UPI003D27E5F1
MTSYETTQVSVRGDHCTLHWWRPDESVVDGPILMFLHGIGAHTGFHGNDLAEPLTEAGFTVFAPDLPGFGATPTLPLEGYATSVIVDWLTGVLDEAGVDRVIPVGHSWGGYLAVQLAAHVPERVPAIALMDGGHLDPPTVDFDSAMATATAIDAEYTFESMERLVTEERAFFSRWSDALDKAYKDSMVLADGRFVMRQRPEVAAAIRVAMGQTPVTTRHELMGERSQRMLVFLPGNPERYARDTELAALTNRAPVEVVWMPDCSHFLPQDAGPAIGRRIASWVRAGGK